MPDAGKEFGGNLEFTDNYRDAESPVDKDEEISISMNFHPQR